MEIYFDWKEIELNFVATGPIKNMLTLVQIMAWHQTGNKSLSEPMMTYFSDSCMGHSA